MIRGVVLLPVLLVAITTTASPARAQTFPFERTFEAASFDALRVQTDDGAVVVSAGGSARVIVSGLVRVRVGFTVPANAVELAQDTAAHPPIDSTTGGRTLLLNPPAHHRAVSVEWHVTVPAGYDVQVTTGSGAITVRGVAGPVVVSTGSGAIALGDLGGRANVETQSGGVTLDGVGHGAFVTTGSGRIKARGVSGGARVRTGSAGVSVECTGPGDVDVRTSSGLIELDGVDGALTATTASGRVTAGGRATKPWTIDTGSSAIDVIIAGPFTLEASSGSGSVDVAQSVNGTVEKRAARGSVGGGGPLVRLTSRSGAVHVR